MDGSPIQVDTRKAIALISYLAVSGESHRRDALATLLWPDTDQARARAALRRTLSALNKAVAGYGLAVDRENVGLDMNADIWVDLSEFRSRLAETAAHEHPADGVCDSCLGPLSGAATLYRGDLLAGFSLRDSDIFDDWQYSQGEIVRRELAGALERLVQCHTLKADLRSAAACGRRWLGLDPLNEEAHRQLMRLYGRSNQRTAALQQYRECVRILDRELGVAPLVETTELYQAIREDLPPSDSPTPEPVSSSVGKEPATSAYGQGGRAGAYPMVGRSNEWSALLQAYASIGDDGHLIVVDGEAGIGKSRLAEEFLAHLRAEGAVTVTTRCHRGEGDLAYGPFVEGLRAAIGQVDEGAVWWETIPAQALAEAARLLPELGGVRGDLPTTLPPEGPGAQSRFFEALGRLIMEVCRGPEPGVLFIDDLHWADEASVDLLTYLVTRLQGRPLCILTTWRGSEVDPGHRLRMLLADAERSGTATLVSPGRLGPSDVAELVKEIPADLKPLAKGFDGRLYRETEGLPFFIVEYLAVLTRGDGSSVGDWPVPSSVRDLLQSRLARLSGTSRQLLDTAAVIGRSFDFDTLQVASGRGEEEAVNALESLIALGLVNELGVASGAAAVDYDFSHDQLRSVVYDDASLARRRLLHRRVANALVARLRRDPNTDSTAGMIAQHCRMAGQDAEAAHYFQLAGDQARALFANSEALSHYRSALVLAPAGAGDLHDAIGDLQTLSGRYGEAIASYETAAAMCDPDTLSDVERKLGNVYVRQGDWDIAESHFQAAADSVGSSAPAGQRARTYADWSLAAHRRGDTERALDLAGQAVRLAEAAEDTKALAQAHNVLGILTRTQGDLDRAVDHLEHSLELAEALGDHGGRVAALNNLALARGAVGDVDQAIELTQTALALCTSQGDRHRGAALHSNLADLLHAAGRPKEAMSEQREAAAIFADIGEESGPTQPEIWKLVEW